MIESTPRTDSEIVKVEDFQSMFLSLRIGEKIPRLQIKEIRKITNPSKQDNLSRVNYKYIIESTEGKLLTVNSWVLWKAISAAIREAGTIQATLELVHLERESYTVKVIK